MTPQYYIYKNHPFQAIQFDGTKEKAQEIINWVLSHQADANIFFSDEVSPWQSEDGKMKHNGVPATLHLVDEHVREGDWVVKTHPILALFRAYPNDEFKENIIPYAPPTPPPTGHEEVSDAIHDGMRLIRLPDGTFEEVSDDVDGTRAPYSGIDRDTSEA